MLKYSVSDNDEENFRSSTSVFRALNRMMLHKIHAKRLLLIKMGTAETTWGIKASLHT